MENSEDHDFPSDRAVNNDVLSALHQHLESQSHISKEEDMASQFYKMVAQNHTRPAIRKSLSFETKPKRKSWKPEKHVHFAGLGEIITSIRHEASDSTDDFVFDAVFDNDRGLKTIDFVEPKMAISVNNILGAWPKRSGENGIKSSPLGRNSKGSSTLDAERVVPPPPLNNVSKLPPPKSDTKRPDRSLSPRTKSNGSNELDVESLPSSVIDKLKFPLTKHIRERKTRSLSTSSSTETNVEQLQTPKHNRCKLPSKHNGASRSSPSRLGYKGSKAEPPQENDKNKPLPKRERGWASKSLPSRLGPRGVDTHEVEQPPATDRDKLSPTRSKGGPRKSLPSQFAPVDVERSPTNDRAKHRPKCGKERGTRSLSPRLASKGSITHDANGMLPTANDKGKSTHANYSRATSSRSLSPRLGSKGSITHDATRAPAAANERVKPAPKYSGAKSSTSLSPRLGSKGSITHDADRMQSTAKERVKSMPRYSRAKSSRSLSPRMGSKGSIAHDAERMPPTANESVKSTPKYSRTKASRSLSPRMGSSGSKIQDTGRVPLPTNDKGKSMRKSSGKRGSSDSRLSPIGSHHTSDAQQSPSNQRGKRRSDWESRSSHARLSSYTPHKGTKRSASRSLSPRQDSNAIDTEKWKKVSKSLSNSLAPELQSEFEQNGMKSKEAVITHDNGRSNKGRRAAARRAARRDARGLNINDLDAIYWIRTKDDVDTGINNCSIGADEHCELKKLFKKSMGSISRTGQSRDDLESYRIDAGKVKPTRSIQELEQKRAKHHSNLLEDKRSLWDK